MQARTPIAAILLLCAASSAARAAEPLTDQDKALRLFQRIAGVPMMLDDERLDVMTALVGAGRLDAAARIATDDAAFYRVTLRDWASVMGNRDESPYSDFDDFQALAIGTVRDNLDARLLLMGNFRYDGPAAPGIPTPSTANNEHYRLLDAERADLRTNLYRITPQWPTIPDAAGLLTTRGWAASHFAGGTNRRALQYAFQEFLCTPIARWKDPGLDEGYIRRDVDRAPGGNHSTFETTCRTCHAPMDAMAGAFATFDFVNGNFAYSRGRPMGKMNQHGSVYPQGNVTSDSSWVNLATKDQNVALGWRGPLAGDGPAALGLMLANSQAFKQCMVQRVFHAICRRNLDAQSEAPLLDNLASGFETSGYRLKTLFQKIAIQPECLGDL